LGGVLDGLDVVSVRIVLACDAITDVPSGKYYQPADVVSAVRELIDCS
jgi:hypothetical protein